LLYTPNKYEIIDIDLWGRTHLVSIRRVPQQFPRDGNSR
jgi:hypothetical protein